MNNEYPADLAPIFEAIADRAARLCESQDVRVFVVEGNFLRYVAGFGDIQYPLDPLRPLTRGLATGRAVIDRAVVHVDDFATVPEAEFPEGRANQRRYGYHTTLAVPLLLGDKALGAILLRRREVRPFDPKHIELVKAFADQAAVAIENLRLSTELKARNAELTEALEQQTATAEILRVISSSPTNIQPVLDAVVGTAARLCDANDVIIRRLDGDALRIAAHFGTVPVVREALAVNRGSFGGRAILERRTIHVEDLAATSEYPISQESRRNSGARTVLVVPLMREDKAIGTIAMRRQEVRPFSDKQIKLLETFAAQAAIAIENVRLFNETKEALEQQTATAEILKVISASPTDIQPVLDAVAQSAARLCGADDVMIRQADGNSLRLVAHIGPIETVSALPMSSGSAIGRAVMDRRTIHIHDSLDVQASKDFPDALEVRRQFGIRTMLATPLLREGIAVGAIGIRRVEVRPFSDREIKLLETFAAQAAIAIENVRLFNETKEALEQQTATSEILAAMSASMADTKPVFDAIVRSCYSLFKGSGVALRLVRNDMLHVEANIGYEAGTVPVDRESAVGACVLDGRAIHFPEIEAAAAEFPRVRQLGLRLGFRSGIYAPLLRRGAAIGTISVLRPKPGAFGDKEIALLKIFADQAVIAIENVRLFKELQARNAELMEALEQQTATAEILKVISSSPTDTQPVFDAIVNSVVRLFRGLHVSLRLVKGDRTEMVACTMPVRGPDIPLNNTDRISIRAILSREVTQLADVLAEGIPESTRQRARERGFRAIMFAPLLKEGAAIGLISVSREAPGAFTEKEIALLKTFADQAVIAIENVRLFNETKEALEQQTVTSEILRVISSSPTDTQPVFEAIVKSGVHLFGGLNMLLRLVRGDRVETVATSLAGWSEKDVFSIPLEDDRFVAPRAILRRDIVHEPDIAVADWAHERMKERGKQFGWRAVLCVPMLRDNTAIGAITVTRGAPGLFTDKQVALLKTFADQAVIAIENVRLFKELQARNAAITEALEQQTATAEILRVISSSPTDLQPVFDAILEKATRLCDAHLGLLGLYDGETFQSVAQRGANADFAKWLSGRGPFKPGSSGGVLTRMIAERRAIQIPDNRESPAYRDRKPYTVAFVELGGARTYLAVPMLKEGRVVGGISIYRPEVRPFTQKQIDLVSTFASQATIAIENVRLFKEIQEKGRQLEIANKHKSDFVANMSHELRTPLNAVIGFSEALLEKMFGELNAKQEDYLRDIHSSGRHLLSLINDILDLSKIEAGRMELELSEFNVPAALKNAMALVRGRAQTHGIALKLRVDPKLGDIQADERKFKQIVVNLLSNAVKFTPDGGHVEVNARRNGRAVKVSVKDTGVGIALEDQAALFEEFRQVGRDVTTRQEGTGLGLALTRRFVELHGGRISVESAPGKGSTFTFTLPLNTVTSDRRPVTSGRGRETRDEKRKTRA